MKTCLIIGRRKFPDSPTAILYSANTQHVMNISMVHGGVNGFYCDLRSDTSRAIEMNINFWRKNPKFNHIPLLLKYSKIESVLSRLDFLAILGSDMPISIPERVNVLHLTAFELLRMTEATKQKIKEWAIAGKS